MDKKVGLPIILLAAIISIDRLLFSVRPLVNGGAAVGAAPPP